MAKEFLSEAMVISRKEHWLMANGMDFVRVSIRLLTESSLDQYTCFTDGKTIIAERNKDDFEGNVTIYYGYDSSIPNN